jgi:hypothetical protein
VCTSNQEPTSCPQGVFIWCSAKRLLVRKGPPARGVDESEEIKRPPKKVGALRKQVISSQYSDLGEQEVTRMRKRFAKVHIETLRAL